MAIVVVSKVEMNVCLESRLLLLPLDDDVCNANADEVRTAREDDEAVRKAVAIRSRRISPSFVTITISRGCDYDGMGARVWWIGHGVKRSVSCE